MATRGRPPKPTEEKRRLGNPGKRPLPVSSNVVPLRPATGAPPYPADLEIEGRKLWDRAWSDAIQWLAPDADGEAVERACRLADDLAKARQRYRVTGDPVDARALVALDKQYGEALGALGFGPVARARLGVAEVTRVSKLDQLRRRTTEA